MPNIDDLVETMIVPVEQIKVDDRYQRSLDEKRVASMAANWDTAQSMALGVSMREDERFYVFDGQHRLAAAKKAGVKELLCLVYVLSVEEEARLFMAINSTAKKPDALDLFNARLFYNDPVALAVRDVCRSCGFEISTNFHSAKKPGYISAIAEVETQYRSTKTKNNAPLNGAQRLTNTLTLIKATWPDFPGAASSVMMKVIDHFLRRYPQANRQRFIEKMSAHDPKVLARRAATFTQIAGSNAETALLDIMVREYNKNLRTGKLHSPLTLTDREKEAS